MRKNYCSNCGSPIKNEGSFCENCGESLEDGNTSTTAPYNSRIENNNDKLKYHKNKYAAFFLSIIPGLGQMYNGQILKGILIPVLLFLFLIIANQYEANVTISGTIILAYLVIYFYNLGDAYKTANDINKNNGNYFYSHKNEQQHGFYEDKMNGLQKADAEISSYFHYETPDGKKNVSLIKVSILIIVLYNILLFSIP